MSTMKTTLIAIGLLLLTMTGHGTRLPLEKRISSGAIPLRGKLLGNSIRPSDAVTLEDVHDKLYLIDIEVGGEEFSVQIDTGSVDLWVLPQHGLPTLTNSTTIPANLTYGSGSCSGTIDFAEVKLGPYTISSQAFINANKVDGMDAILDAGASGILGLSFSSFSTITQELQSAYGNISGPLLGRTPIANIMAQNTTSSVTFDILLTRDGDLGATSNSTLLIGEHLPGYENVTRQPSLYKEGTTRWTLTLDGMNVNGKSFSFASSVVPGLRQGQVGALLDTGCTFSLLPPAAVDAIYSSIPGAVNVTGLGYPFQWIVPCVSSVNVSFVLGGVDYPIHLLDISVVTQSDDGSATFCYNAFQYNFLSGPGFSDFDLFLGDSFLRNVYASFNMGDPSGSGNNSFVQLLSTTNIEQAWDDFYPSRLAAMESMPPPIDPSFFKLEATRTSNLTLPPPVVAAIPPGVAIPAGNVALASEDLVSSSGASSASDTLKKYGIIAVGLLAGNVVIGLVLCILGLVTCLRLVIKPHSKTRSISPSYAPVRSKDAQGNSENSYFN